MVRLRSDEDDKGRTVEPGRHLDRLLDVRYGTFPSRRVRQRSRQLLWGSLVLRRSYSGERQVVLVKSSLDCIEVLLVPCLELDRIEAEVCDVIDAVEERFVLVDHLQADRWLYHVSRVGRLIISYRSYIHYSSDRKLRVRAITRGCHPGFAIGKRSLHSGELSHAQSRPRGLKHRMRGSINHGSWCENPKHMEC